MERENSPIWVKKKQRSYTQRKLVWKKNLKSVHLSKFRYLNTRESGRNKRGDESEIRNQASRTMELETANK